MPTHFYTRSRTHCTRTHTHTRKWAFITGKFQQIFSYFQVFRVALNEGESDQGFVKIRKVCCGCKTGLESTAVLQGTKILPCHVHLVCASCLQQKKTGPEEIGCLGCQKVMPMPPGGLQAFPMTQQARAEFVSKVAAEYRSQGGNAGSETRAEETGARQGTSTGSASRATGVVITTNVKCAVCEAPVRHVTAGKVLPCGEHVACSACLAGIGPDVREIGCNKCKKVFAVTLDDLDDIPTTPHAWRELKAMKKTNKPLVLFRENMPYGEFVYKLRRRPQPEPDVSTATTASAEVGRSEPEGRQSGPEASVSNGGGNDAEATRRQPEVVYLQEVEPEMTAADKIEVAKLGWDVAKTVTRQPRRAMTSEMYGMTSQPYGMTSEWDAMDAGVSAEDANDCWDCIRSIICCFCSD